VDRSVFQAYIIRCLANGRAYIGITSRGLKRRWSEHIYDASRSRMAISRAIAKYGASQFRIEAICSARSWEDIWAVESVLIEQHGTRAPAGYNVGAGGEGPFGVKHSPESVERSAAKHRGKPCHPNTIEAGRRSKGQPKSAEMRAKLSAAKKGVPRSEVAKEKIRAYWAARRAAGDFKTATPYAHSAKL
jgi:group I intron endonuclease